MLNMRNFSKGMGMGGWLTNYKRFNVLPKEKREHITIGDMEHFMEFITERDIEYIASLGMDHIRLGFDQIVLEESPYNYRESIIEILKKFVFWCKKYNIHPILNLHKAIGNYCDIPDENTLMQNNELQKRFVALWLKLEEVFCDEEDVSFELMNEVVNSTPDEWNALYEKTVKAIRNINKERIIIIGTIDWNSPNFLKQLKILRDENIIYTFHCYAPFEFTHQQGVLQEKTLYYNRKMPYPTDDIQRYKDYYRLHGNHTAYNDFDRMDIAFLRKCLMPVKEFIAENPGVRLWCSEFGTIRHCNITYRENWMNDMIKLFKEMDIPYCVWNYLSTPNDGNRFSLVDDDTRVILSERMGRIIRGETD